MMTREMKGRPRNKIERFHRTPIEGWAFKTFYPSQSDRLAVLSPWLHQFQPPPARLSDRQSHTHHPVGQPGGHHS
jgi:hypothetical protein